jgi:hypothetical protein
MPRGEDVEIAEPEDLLPFLVALFLVAPRALTFLLFFTRLPSSFENLAAANRRKIQLIHFLRFLGLPRSTPCEQIDRPALPRWDLSRNMTVAIEIGRTATGESASLDLEELLATRLLV